MKRIYIKTAIIISAIFILSCEGVNDIYERGKDYSIGDAGPAGGIIFYVNENYEEDGWMYLEAAPEDEIPDSIWSNNILNPIPGADSMAIGSGLQNTTDISYAGTVSGRAADRCYLKNSGGYSDWFLPSSSELYLMYSGLAYKGIGNFIFSDYWSSTEFNSSSAYCVNMGSGDIIGNITKNSERKVRAIRRF